MLNGMMVLDIAQSVAGAFCARLLADYGAEVIKVEPPTSGDFARHVRPYPADTPDLECSSLFLYLNANKKGITLDLTSSTGQSVFLDLAKRAHVVVATGPQSSEDFRTDARLLLENNPSTVATFISPFGSAGPYRDWKATEITLFALSGRMNTQGHPDREPLKYALNAYQYFAGQMASLPTIAAAMKAKDTGQGEVIDLSILDTIVSDVENEVLSYDYTKEKGVRTVATGREEYLMGVYPAADGFVAIHGFGYGEAWMPRLYKILDRPDMQDDPKFATREARVAHIDEFSAILYSWLTSHGKLEIAERASEERYPMAPVYTVADIVNDSAYWESGFLKRIEHPRAGTHVYPSGVCHTEDKGPKGNPAPLLGQHNEEIYCQRLGLSEHALGDLRRLGAI